MSSTRKNARSANCGRVNGKPISGRKILTKLNNSTKKEEKQLISNDAGRVVGHTLDNKFFKNVLGSKHMLRTPRGWANDKSIIEFLIKSKVQFVEIHDKESNKIYRAATKKILEKGLPINRKFGDQIVLPLKYWEVIEENKPKQLTFLTGGLDG